MPLCLETVVTVPVSSDTVRFNTVPRIVRSDTKLYDTVLGVFNAVHYGTPCTQDFVLVTVPFSFVQGSKTSKRNNTHIRNKNNKKYSRTPLIVPRIIDQYKDADPHLDRAEAPLAFITMDLVVPQPEALGGPTETGL